MKRVIKLDKFDYECEGNSTYLITNGFGGYYLDMPNTHYRGWALLEPKSWQLRKAVDKISIDGAGEEVEVEHNFKGVRKIYLTGFQETTYLYNHSMLYRLYHPDPKVKKTITITLDNRYIYDGSMMGRVYRIEKHHDAILVHFIQYDPKDNSEDDDDKKIIYEEYIAIKGANEFDILNSWRKQEYSWDKNRGTPYEYWVYDALRLTMQHEELVISRGKTEHEALTRSRIVSHHFEDVVYSLEKNYDVNNNGFNQKQFAARSCANYALTSFYQTISFEHRLIGGIFAGFPWFFQFWTRDELITLGGFIDREEYELSKNIIMRHADNLLINGTLPNRYPGSELASADALGWFAKRTFDLIKKLKEEKQLFKIFNPSDLDLVLTSLKKGLEKLREKMNGLLVYSGFNETWMDTDYNDDGREGYRIEIQSLTICLYDAIIFISKINNEDYKIYKKERDELKKKIRSVFIHEDNLLDGIYDAEGERKDYTMRSNIFLSAYLTPDLLSGNEWIKVFHKHLDALWLPWGGLSTIDRNHHLYQAHYTGQNNKSYHRGDSWYFVNNIAAISMHNIASSEFKKYITGILEASSTEILSLGLLGIPSELSSSASQDAEACLAQAWSAGTLVELFKKMEEID